MKIEWMNCEKNCERSIVTMILFQRGEKEIIYSKVHICTFASLMFPLATFWIKHDF